MQLPAVLLNFIFQYFATFFTIHMLALVKLRKYLRCKYPYLTFCTTRASNLKLKLFYLCKYCWIVTIIVQRNKTSPPCYYYVCDMLRSDWLIDLSTRCAITWLLFTKFWANSLNSVIFGGWGAVVTLADLHWQMPGARPPRVQILSF